MGSFLLAEWELVDRKIAGFVNINTGVLDKIEAGSRLYTNQFLNRISPFAISLHSGGTVRDIHIPNHTRWNFRSRIDQPRSIAKIAVGTNTTSLTRVLFEGQMENDDSTNVNTQSADFKNFFSQASTTATGVIAVPAGRVIAIKEPAGGQITCSSGSVVVSSATSGTTAGLLNAPLESKILWLKVEANNSAKFFPVSAIPANLQLTVTDLLATDCSGARVKVIQDYSPNFLAAIGNLTSSPFNGFLPESLSGGHSQYDETMFQGPWQAPLASGSPAILNFDMDSDTILGIYAHYLGIVPQNPAPLIPAWELSPGDSMRIFELEK